MTAEVRGARLAHRVAHAAVTAWVVWVVNASAAAVRGIGPAEQFTEHVAWWQYALFAGLVVVHPVAARSLTPVLVGPDRDLRPAGAAARPAALLAVLAATVVAVGLQARYAVTRRAARAGRERYPRGPKMGVGPRYLRAVR
ncbi:hypothetical protein N7925_13515 [Streptomyces sp. CA-278952]|uniref:hypothetical protein n=1 Tax=unclassified Streptomyces TaxID=2593676 RepID=UPI002367B5C0|nr:hypothetical protein [Streptomyces sp. CA-278952]WDG29302.1 hypothetical protein N7925_13515 [Streptomyces sp. CA-278952]